MGTIAKSGMRSEADEVLGVGTAVDLRSDTVTRPTKEMRAAMAAAEVGDDVYGEDPTVNRLEKRAAEMFGKEAALFVPTGCMGNLIAIKVWTHHGDEVICDERSHVNLYELASMAAIAGCMPRIVRGVDGLHQPSMGNTHVAADRLAGAQSAAVLSKLADERRGSFKGFACPVREKSACCSLAGVFGVAGDRSAFRWLDPARDAALKSRLRKSAQRSGRAKSWQECDWQSAAADAA